MDDRGRDTDASFAHRREEEVGGDRSLMYSQIGMDAKFYLWTGNIREVHVQCLGQPDMALLHV